MDAHGAGTYVYKTWGDLFGYIARKSRAKKYDDAEKYLKILCENSITSPIGLASKPWVITAIYKVDEEDGFNHNLQFLAMSIRYHGEYILKEWAKSQSKKKENVIAEEAEEAPSNCLSLECKSYCGQCWAVDADAESVSTNQA